MEKQTKGISKTYKQRNMKFNIWKFLSKTLLKIRSRGIRIKKKKKNSLSWVFSSSFSLPPPQSFTSQQESLTRVSKFALIKKKLSMSKKFSIDKDRIRKRKKKFFYFHFSLLLLIGKLNIKIFIFFWETL